MVIIRHIPKTAMLIDTAIAIVLTGIGIYHLTQPDKAWRSGIIELTCSVLLLMAAHRMPRTKAVMTNAVLSVPLLIVGIRHLIHGGGWKTGITELVFTVMLIVAAIIIYRQPDGNKV